MVAELEPLWPSAFATPTTWRIRRVGVIPAAGGLGQSIRERTDIRTLRPSPRRSVSGLLRRSGLITLQVPNYLISSPAHTTCVRAKGRNAYMHTWSCQRRAHARGLM